MDLTRADFLKLASLTALGAAGLPAVASARTALETPAASQAPTALGATPAGELDSQRFRRAVAEGDLAQVQSFLERDPALAGSRDERGRSALVLAWLAGHAEVAAAVRERLPSLDVVEAVLAGDVGRVRELRERYPALIDEMHPIGGTPVHAAARFGRPEMVMALVGSDFNRPAADPPGLTALRLAAQHPDVAAAEEMVDIMVGNAADPRAPQGDGVTPLHVAAAAGGLDMIRVLILDGADPAAKDPEGRTALDLALRHGRQEAAELLRRADRLPRDHRTSRFAYTADGSRYQPPEGPALPREVVGPYVGVAHGNLAEVKRLLALYPNVLLANAPWDELAVEAGAHVGAQDVVRLQLDRGAPCSICTAAMAGLTDRVRALLAEDRLRIWEHGAHNIPGMHFPAFGGGGPEQRRCAELLLDAGADVDAPKRGQTALHVAARLGQLEMAELLLARGADPGARARTRQGDITPLDVARRAGQEKLVDLLSRGGGGG